MASRDLKSDVDFAQSIAPAAYNASANGTGVDLRGYEAATAHIDVGVVTDGTQTPKIQESSDNGVLDAWADVAAADLLGTFAACASNTLQRVGYRGAKRYIRVVLTVVAGATGAVVSGSVVRGYPNQRPLA